MATVAELLDRLASGAATLDQVAADFAVRSWPAHKPATDEQAWGLADDEAPDPNSWDAVNADSRLTPEQYQVLARAKSRARQA